MESITRKAIFVAAIDLSGSSVLDLALGSIPGIAGLGELDNVIYSQKNPGLQGRRQGLQNLLCTCGKQANCCPVWASITGDESSVRPYNETLQQLLHNIASQGGGHLEAVVDSSKEPQALVRLAKGLSSCDGWDPEPLVIVLYRGPIKWLASDDARARRRNRSRNFRIRSRRLRKWALRYRKLESLLKTVPYKTCWLDLTFFRTDPDKALSLSLERIGLGHLIGNVDLASSKSHIIWGSHHMYEESTSKKILKPARLGFKQALLGFFVLVVTTSAWPIVLKQALRP